MPIVMASLLVSPNRGLFVTSPILLLSLYGIILMIRAKPRDPLDLTVVAILAAHLLVISRASDWWAGHSFGARFWADLTPLLVYCLVPVIGHSLAITARNRTGMRLTFGLLLALSVFAHHRAATTWDVWAWNSDPVSIDVAPGRAWDWRDVQMLRGLSGHERTVE